MFKFILFLKWKLLIWVQYAAGKEWIATFCSDHSPLTWTSDIFCCKTLIKHYITFSLKFTFCQGTCFVNGYYQFITWGWSLQHSFSILALLKFWAGQFFIGRKEVLVLVHCSLLGSIPGLCSLDATSILLSCGNQNCLQALPNAKRNYPHITLENHCFNICLFVFWGTLVFCNPKNEGFISWH